MLAISNLKPEDQRAINHLSCILDKELFYRQINSISSDIWNNNSYQVFSEPLKVKDIPSGSNWRWNQTKSRKSTFLAQHSANISFIKLMPRKSRKTSPLPFPNYKIWYFSINYISCDKQPLYILWCEKGVRIEIESLDKLFNTKVLSFNLPPNKLYATKISYICN